MDVRLIVDKDGSSQRINHLSSLSIYTITDELASGNGIIKIINQLTETGEVAYVGFILPCL